MAIWAIKSAALLMLFAFERHLPRRKRAAVFALYSLPLRMNFASLSFSIFVINASIFVFSSGVMGSAPIKAAVGNTDARSRNTKAGNILKCMVGDGWRVVGMSVGFVDMQCGSRWTGDFSTSSFVEGFACFFEIFGFFGAELGIGEVE